MYSGQGCDHRFRHNCDRFDNIGSPILAQPKFSAEVHIRISAEQAAHFGAGVGFLELIHILRGNAKLLSGKGGEHRPLHDVEPLIITLAHHRTKRLLRQRHIENDVIIGIGQHRPARHKTGLVGGHRITALFGIGGEGAIGILKHGGGVRQIAGCHLIRQVQLGRRALLHTDRRAVQVFELRDIRGFWRHDTLTVVERGRNKIGAVVGVAGERPRRIADKHINLAALQRGEALLGGQRPILDFVDIIEDRCCQRFAVINVETAERA